MKVKRSELIFFYNLAILLKCKKVSIPKVGLLIFQFWTPHFVVWTPHFGWTPRLNYTVPDRSNRGQHAHVRASCGNKEIMFTIVCLSINGITQTGA